MLSANSYVPKHLNVQRLHRGKIKQLPSFIVLAGSETFLISKKHRALLLLLMEQPSRPFEKDIRLDQQVLTM